MSKHEVPDKTLPWLWDFKRQTVYMGGYLMQRSNAVVALRIPVKAFDGRKEEKTKNSRYVPWETMNFVSCLSIKKKKKPKKGDSKNTLGLGTEIEGPGLLLFLPREESM